ncbi:sensor histidine kinase [Nesterenkonia rhizosphaerae]|uniref:Signal transduction histidine kinase subgroup 3 dimerisation and phosphoacceptor domain-containing protein n=1 Tax=Nesterenkonia rhizosphaerae TaxID=1348272 RepID=A0ABP9FXC2_9MICC
MDTDVPPGHTRRRHLTETFSGAGIGALCLGIGLLLLFLGPEPYIPRGLWFGLFLASLFSVVWAVGGEMSRRKSQMTYCGAVVLSWLVLLTIPDQGMLVVLLVAVAAVGSYLLPLWAVGVVVALNCCVVAVQFLIRGTHLIDLTISVAFYLIIHCASVLSTYTLHKESALRAELEQKNVELEAAGVMLEDSAATAERLRISRELHDTVGHQLTVLNLELEAARHLAQNGPANEHVERAAGVAKQLLAEVRATVGELRASGSADLQASLQRLAAAVPSLDIHVEVDPAVSVDDQQAEALLRAAQEIITNAIKHSEAQELTLSVRREGTDTVLTGTNDGYAPKVVTFGHGLTGLRERVELLGGNLSVSSSPNFTVEVRLP